MTSDADKCECGAEKFQCPQCGTEGCRTLHNPVEQGCPEALFRTVKLEGAKNSDHREWEEFPMPLCRHCFPNL